MEKKAVVVGLGLRYQKEEHELYPTYGQLYAEGYKFADRGYEDLYLLSEPLPEGTELGDNEYQTLHDLGYEVYDLEQVYADEEGTPSHLEYVVWHPTHGKVEEV